MDDDGLPVAGVEFEATFSNGKVKKFKTDKNGYKKIEKVPQGKVTIRLKDGSTIESYGSNKAATRADIHQEDKKENLIEYIIRKGDSLSKIGARFGVHYKKLYRTKGPDGITNQKRLRSGNINLIYPGELIYVPTNRRIVKLHTDNAATSATKIRIRKRKRTAAQRKRARKQAVYGENLKRYAVDNLAIVAGWDDDNNTLDIEELCDAISPIIKLLYKHVGKNWNLYVIQKQIMKYYSYDGEFKYEFKLATTPMGLSGAYGTFEVDGQERVLSVYDNSYIMGIKSDSEETIGINSIIVGEADQRKFIDSFVEIDEAKKLINFKKLPVYYLAPASLGEWQSIVIRGGNRCLDEYIGDKDYNEKAHDRNLTVIKTYNSHYRGLLKDYIKKLKAIPADNPNGEDAIRTGGKPPEPYRFPMPEKASESQLKELRQAVADCSSFQGWQAISDKLFEIQNFRWPSMAARHQEGSIFFRVKFTLEPSVQEKINSLQDQYLFGHLSSYKTIKLEWNFDVGSDGFKTGKSQSKVFKEEGVLKIKKFEIGAGREVEIDSSGGKKVTVKGKFLGYGIEASSDGEQKVTGPIASSSFNQKTAEGGMGANFGVPGVGSLYVGINFVLIKSETLFIYFSGAPGFFERRSCDSLVRTYWTKLTLPEILKLELLGWNQELWDFKDLLDLNKLPSSTRTAFDALPADKRKAAVHLGFQGNYADNWLNFWKKLPPVRIK